MKLDKLYSKFAHLPFGNQLFSLLVCFKAPYFSTIKPVITELTATRCVVFMRKRRRVQNHIGTVHAIAMCNMCELAFGLTVDAGLPSHLRWIPKGMTVRYLKKAETNLQAICDFAGCKTLTPGDHQVTVQVTDTNNVVVMDATITVYISQKS